MNILKVLTDKRKKGNIGEAAVCKHLRRRGYKILERNYVADNHEIDIIAKGHGHVCFVEVKTQSKNAANPYGLRPADAVDAKKRRSIIDAAKSYTSLVYDNSKFRFDVAEVFLDANRKVTEINYLEGAFSADRNYR